MTIAGDAVEMEVGLETGTADSGNAGDAVRRIVASKPTRARDDENQFKPHPKKSDDRTPEEDVERWLRALAGPSGSIGSRAKPFICRGFWPDLTRPTVYTRLSSLDVTARTLAGDLQQCLFS
jgi:hypothetical protein